MKLSLRLPEKELPGVIHGYSLADSTFLHLLDTIYQIPERVFLHPWISQIRIDRPIFIIGPYRSGTTILQEIITSHPAVGYFWYLTNAFGRSPVLSYLTKRFFCKISLLDDTPISPVHNPGIPAKILSPFECESIWISTCHSLWDESCQDMGLSADFSNPAFEHRLRRLIRAHLFASHTSRFLNKNPVNSLRIPYLHKLFPDAIFINIIRNPFDTIISHYRTAARVEKAFNRDAQTRRIFRQQLYIDMLSHRIRTREWPETQTLNREHPLLGIASQWVAMQQAILNAASDPEISLLDIRYEDLAHYPEQILRHVWNFVELNDEHAERITTEYTACLRPRPSKKLTDEEQKYLPRIQEIIAPAAKQLGY
jgi:hypothetical protein